MKHLRPIYIILFLCILGSIVRYVYAWIYAPWTQSPDHMAFEILQRHGALSYDEFIHYPHEGGTILLALLSRIAGFFSDFNSLTIAAFMLDVASRFVQLWVVQRLLGTRMLWWFGAWTVFASPFLLPWGTVSFGLHAISACFPFLLMYLMHLNAQTTRAQIRNGFFLGLACWFSYSNVILIPVYIIYQLIRRNRFRQWIFALISLSGVLLLHLLVRMYANAGFELDAFSVATIRGESLVLNTPETWKRLYQVWWHALPESAAGIKDAGTLINTIVLMAWRVLFLAGTAGWAYHLFRRHFSPAVRIQLLTVLLFILSYALSPFFYEGDEIGSYVAYRHLMYILPMLSLLVLLGLRAWWWSWLPLSLFLATITFSGVAAFRKEPERHQIDIVTGWVLGKKLGHSPERLSDILQSSRHRTRDLFQGAGWGIGTALFTDVRAGDSSVAEARTAQLLQLYRRFPVHYQKDVRAGIELSFSDQVYPRLDEAVFTQIDMLLNSGSLWSDD